MTKTYTIEPHGKKFATICRTDGYWSITWLSKNKNAARRKGDEFVSGVRTATRTYVTPYGRAINEAKSRIPRHFDEASRETAMRKARFAELAATVAAIQWADEV